MSRTAAAVALVWLVAAEGACATVRRCPVPDPVTEAAPGPRLPLAVEVRYAPPTAPVEVRHDRETGLSGPRVLVVDAAAPTRSLFDRLAASLFERTAPPADVVLELRLEAFRAGAAPFGQFTSEVAYRVALQTTGGAEIVAFDVAGASSVAGSLRTIGFCGARGEATALAMQEAGADAIRKLSASTALAAWLAARGLERPAFTVRTFESYPSPPASPSDTSTDTSPAPPAPVQTSPPPGPVLPRALTVAGGLSVLRPETTAGKLEQPSRGIGVLQVRFGGRLREWLSLELPLDRLTRSYSAAGVPHLVGFGPRTSLESLSFGVGLRVTPPLGARPVLEPWVGATARVLYTRLTVTYFGGLSGGDPTDTAWSAGADVGAGLNLYVAAPWVVGFEVRRLFARAQLEPLGAVGVGGVLVGGSLGVAIP